MFFEIWKSLADSQYYWRLKAANGLTIADGSEGYKEKRDCESGVSLVRSGAASAPVRDITGD